MVAGNATDDAEAKGRAVSCKGTKVAVTVGKKRSCQPFAKLFPRPQGTDIRLAYLQQALKFDPATALRGKKRRRARTLQSGFGAAGKRAQKKLLKLLPKALGFIDRKGGGARSSSFPAGPALASAGCQPGPAGPTGHTGGASIGALGDNGGYIDAPVGGGIRVRITFVSCGGVTHFNVPGCPSASGSVDASGSGEFRATTEVWDGSQLVSRNSTVFEEKAKAHGEVGADAKLSSIDVEHTQEVFIVASGGIVIRGGVTRKVRIQMPAAAYDPSQASARFFGDPIAPDSGADSFASTAAAAIAAYRTAEARWSTFNPGGPYCAEPIFSPDSNAVKLKKGDKKQIGIYAKSRADGGRASGARWTLLNPLNADFSPGTSQDASPTIQYAVSKSPQGSQVKVTVKFTSTAGVGEKTWTQPIEQSNGIHHLTGEFGGEFKYPVIAGLTEQTWHGTIALEGSLKDGFELTSGSITVEASGADASQLSGCQQEAKFTEDLLGAGLFLVTTAPGEVPEAPPYEYLLNAITESHALIIRRVACDKTSQEEGLEGTEYPITPRYELFVEGQVSADGIDFSGTQDDSAGETTDVQYWDLHGTE